MPAAEFGTLVVETDVDTAVVATLRKWLPTYIAQVERERNLAVGALARPVAGSYANTLEDDEFVDHRLPAIIVTTAATNDVERFGDGSYAAMWMTVVSSVVRGRTPPETRMLAALFSGCVRRVLVQASDLGGSASNVLWRRGGVQPVPDATAAGRYLAAGINEFVVVTDDVLTTRDSPLEPDPLYGNPDPQGNPNQPYDDFVTSAGGVSVDVTGRS